MINNISIFLYELT